MATCDPGDMRSQPIHASGTVARAVPHETWLSAAELAPGPVRRTIVNACTFLILVIALSATQFAAVQPLVEKQSSPLPYNIS
jgi:hypothetical protein